MYFTIFFSSLTIAYHIPAIHPITIETITKNPSTKNSTIIDITYYTQLRCSKIIIQVLLANTKTEISTQTHKKTSNKEVIYSSCLIQKIR